MTALTRNRKARQAIQKFRRVLENVDGATREEILDVLEESGPRLRNFIKSRTPIRSGNLSRGIKYGVLKKSLTLSVGLLNKEANGRLFYGHIVDSGRRGGPAKVSRRTKSGRRSNYIVNVKASSGNRFFTGSQSLIRKEVEPRLTGIWNRILRRAERGG